MPVPVFKDVNPYNVSQVYPCTNEEPDMLSTLLGKQRFENAAAIMSGGEVLFSVIVPRCKKVTTIDHSYGSMAMAFLKAILLDQYGAKELKRMFFEDNFAKMQPLLETAKQALPPELQKYIVLTSGCQFSYELASSFRREWHYMSPIILERTRRKLGEVTALHGDISDLAAYGPFDLLYVSNAMEHTGRSKLIPKLTDFAPMLKKDGLVLFTAGSVYNKHPTPAGWEVTGSLRGVRTSWTHYACRQTA